MEISGASGNSGVSALELKGLQLAKKQQEAEGAQTLQLLESAGGVPSGPSPTGSVGGTIDTFA